VNPYSGLPFSSGLWCDEFIVKHLRQMDSGTWDIQADFEAVVFLCDILCRSDANSASNHLSISGLPNVVRTLHNPFEKALLA
jgi:hypothetical protein